jgi:hypothetical protein
MNHPPQLIARVGRETRWEINGKERPQKEI